MIKNKHLPHNITENRIDITFCGKGKCKCPTISMDKDNDMVTLGGDKEGYTKFTKEVFKEFIQVVMEDKGNGQLPGNIKITQNPEKTKMIFSGDDKSSTEFTMEEFKLFVDEVRDGTFDTLVG
tara:strand:- start:202 stop:570 length:369 start_codon:yes stop_codon:yes gene_type:complete